MSSPAQRARLERECDVFARLLAGLPADEALRAGYVAAHELGAVRPTRGVGGFDRALVAIARRGTLAARFVDAHAALLDRGGLLRHKLVLVLALLESGAPSEARVDRPTPGSRAGFVVGATVRGVVWLALLALGLLPLLALRAASALAAPRRREADAEAAP